MSSFVYSAVNVSFHMVINPGTLSVNMVDQNFLPISQPSVNLLEKEESADCQTSLGILGTTAQQIYVRNPGAANRGWTATLSALSPQSVWAGGVHSMDYNDSTDNGCADGPDSDSVAGRLKVDFLESQLYTGKCLYNCNVSHIAVGSTQYFSEGITDSITLLTASPDSSDMGDWVLLGTRIIQTIPHSQQPADNYTLDLYLSLIAT